MPKRKAPEPEAPVRMDDPEQSRRFIETARELGCDPDDPRVVDVLRGMAARPPQPRSRQEPSGAHKAPKEPGRTKR